MEAHEFTLRMRTNIQAMQANRPQDVLFIANDLKALVQLRIQTSGENFTGAKFSPYSPQYAKKRRAAGAQTSYVDFTVTGQLWARVVSNVASHNEQETVVVTTAPDDANQNKLRGAVSRPKGAPRGNILIPSDSEMAIARQANADRIRKYISNG